MTALAGQLPKMPGQLYAFARREPLATAAYTVAAASAVVALASTVDVASAYYLGTTVLPEMAQAAAGYVYSWVPTVGGFSSEAVTAVFSSAIAAGAGWVGRHVAQIHAHKTQ